MIQINKNEMLDEIIEQMIKKGYGENFMNGDLVVAMIKDVLERYCGGELTALDEVEVSQPGGPFQLDVWSAMRTIEPGTIDSYGGLAARAGRPNAYRAVGTACSVNLVAPFVPCHRVVAAKGIGGYGYGLAIKRALLEHEGASLG